MIPRKQRKLTISIKPKPKAVSKPIADHIKAATRQKLAPINHGGGHSTR